MPHAISVDVIDSITYSLNYLITKNAYAVINPLQVVGGYGGRKVAHKKFFIDNKEYLLRVVYEETEEICTVVTAYITSQISRYWKE